MIDTPSITIAGRRIGTSHPPYVVAELSANHGGSLDQALRSVEVAHESGADALKIQSYRAEELTLRSDLPDFKIGEGPWNGRTLFDLYEEAQLPWEWHEPIFRRGAELGLTVFSSPFHESAVELLEELDCPAYKIASFEIVDTPLIRRVATTRKPLIISTGMAEEDEIRLAVLAAREGGATDIALLHCISAYPAPDEEANLLAIPKLANRYEVVVGLSDHTLTNISAVGAVVLGASIIEKHFKSMPGEAGPDAAFSLTPDRFRCLVQACRSAWAARGDGAIGTTPSEEKSLIFRRSLYLIRDVKAGEQLTTEHVRSIRPGHGLPPAELPRVIGAKAKRDLPRGTALKWDLLRP